MSAPLARNTLLGLLGQLVPLLAAFLAIPAILSGLGEDRLGLLGLGWVVLGYFGLLDLGLGRAATRFAAEALGRGARSELPAIVWSAVMVQGLLGLIAAAALGLVSPMLAEQLTDSAALRPEAVATFRVLAVAIPIVMTAASFRGVLEAAQRFDLMTAVSAAGASLNFLIPWAGVGSGWTLTTILWLLVAARALTLIAYVILASRLFPELLAPVMAGPALRKLVRFGAWATVSNVIGPVLDQLDRVLLGILAGVGAVGVYTVPQEIAFRIRVLPGAVAAAVFPRFSALEGAEDPESIRRQYRLSIRFLCLALAPPVVAGVILGPDLLALWLDPQFAALSGTALKLLVIGVLANAIAFIPFAFLWGVNRPDLPAKFHLLELPIFVVLALLLIPRWGASGAAAAWAVRAGLDTCFLLWAARRSGAHQPVQGNSAGMVAWLLLLGIALLSGFTALVASWSPAVRVAWGGALAMAVGLTGWFWILLPDDRNRIVAWARP